MCLTQIFLYISTLSTYSCWNKTTYSYLFSPTVILENWRITLTFLYYNKPLKIFSMVRITSHFLLQDHHCLFAFWGFLKFLFLLSLRPIPRETTQTKPFRHLQVWGWSTYCQVGRLLSKARGKAWHLVGDEEKEKGSMGSTSDLCLRGEEQLPLSAFGFLSCGNWPLFSYSEIPAEVSKDCCVLLICKCCLSYFQSLIWNCVRMQDKALMLVNAVTSLHPSVLLVSACRSCSVV